MWKLATILLFVATPSFGEHATPGASPEQKQFTRPRDYPPNPDATEDSKRKDVEDAAKEEAERLKKNQEDLAAALKERKGTLPPHIQDLMRKSGGDLIDEFETLFGKSPEASKLFSEVIARSDRERQGLLFAKNYSKAFDAAKAGEKLSDDQKSVLAEMERFTSDNKETIKAISSRSGRKASDVALQLVRWNKMAELAPTHQQMAKDLARETSMLIRSSFDHPGIATALGKAGGDLSNASVYVSAASNLGRSLLQNQNRPGADRLIASNSGVLAKGFLEETSKQWKENHIPAINDFARLKQSFQWNNGNLQITNPKAFAELKQKFTGLNEEWALAGLRHAKDEAGRRNATVSLWASGLDPQEVLKDPQNAKWKYQMPARDGKPGNKITADSPTTLLLGLSNFLPGNNKNPQDPQRIANLANAMDAFQMEDFAAREASNSTSDYEIKLPDPKEQAAYYANFTPETLATVKTHVQSYEPLDIQVFLGLARYPSPKVTNTKKVNSPKPQTPPAKPADAPTQNRIPTKLNLY